MRRHRSIRAYGVQRNTRCGSARSQPVHGLPPSTALLPSRPASTAAPTGKRMSTTEYSDIIVEERANGVALVKLNRPEKLNAFGGTMNEELARYLESLNHGDYRVRAVVLTGEGRAF